MSTTAPAGLGALLEREEALATLEAALTAAAAGSGRIALVAGEAGIGKTALVRAFEATARDHVRVVTGACEALFTPRPLGPIHDAARALGGPLLAALTTGAERVTIFSALLAELESAPTLAVLEDVHWADEATLDAIAYLGRRLHETPSLVVLTFRDDELDARHPLRLVVGELPSRSTSRIVLDRLSPRAVDELARQAEHSAQGLYAATGGNPFFVTEVLAVRGEAIPATVRDAVLARAGRLSAGGQRLLEAVAIVPGHVDLWLLEQLAPLELRHLDECLASGVLVDTPHRIEFRHELARLVIEESLTPQRRVSLNRTALDALATPPSGVLDLAGLAHHAEVADDVDRVLRFAPAAAALAANVGAHREAAAQYARALRFADGLPLGAQAQLWEKLSYENYLTGDFDDAIPATTRALESYRKLQDVRGEGECLLALSRLLWSVGRTPEGSTTGREALVLLESTSAGRQLALAHTQLAEVSMILDDYAEVLRLGSRAAGLARQLGEYEIAASARMLLSCTEYALGAGGGAESLERELALALSEGLEEVAARAYNHLVRLGMQRRDYALVDRHLDRGFEYCRDRELGNFRQGMAAERAHRFLDHGDWVEATDTAHLVLSTARTAGMAPFVALTVLGQVRARRGDPDVWSPLDRAAEMAAGTGELRRFGLLAAARAEAAWLAGDPERAAAEAQTALALAENKRHAWFAGHLAYWRWKGGHEGEAPSWIAEPYALQISGDWQGAASAWRQLGCPYETALALSEADDDAALRHALELCSRLGAQPLATVVSARLRELGMPVPRGPRASTRENPAGLTTREIEVLALVAQGRRNAEIADRLYLSKRTVDHHVSSILRKLGAQTRGEAAAAAVQLGISDTG